MWRTYLYFLLLLVSGCGNLPKGTYKIGVDPSWYPLDTQGKETNLLAFSGELLQEIARKQTIKIDLVYTNWDTLFEQLENRKYSAVLSSTQPYTFLEKRYSFSSLYLALGAVLVVPVGSDASSLEAMKGKEVAVIAGSKSPLLLEPIGALIRSYPTIPDALNAVAQGVNDGALIDLLAAQSYTRDLFQRTLKIATPPLTDVGLRLVALYEEAPGLIKAFDEALEELKRDGTYAKLAEKWELPSSL